MEKKEIKSLTSIRAIAALWIVYYHYNFFGVVMKITPSMNFLHKVGSFGDIGVDIFFVLSGIVIAYSKNGSIISNSSNYAGYVRDRMIRIYPSYCFVLFLFVIFVLFCNLSGVKLNFPYTVKGFFSQLFLVGGFFPSWGWNSPSWSLTYEVFAYFLLFPILLFIFENRLKSYYVFFLSLFLSFRFFYPFSRPVISEMLGDYFWIILDRFFQISSCFSSGFFFCLILKKFELIDLSFWKNKSKVLFFIFLSCIFILFCNSSYLSLVFLRSALIIFCILLMFSIVLIELTEKSSFLIKVMSCSFLNYLGKISYAIYLSHMLVYVVVSDFLKIDSILAWMNKDLFIFLYFLTPILVSIFIYSYIEERARFFLKDILR